MSSLFIRRAIAWGVGMALGFVITLLLITFFLPAVSPDPNATAVSIGQYGRVYFLVTMVPIGLIFMTWLDYFLDAKIWPD
ncbi:MAG: hypothetical protein H7Y09_03675 [Chitinophagaceae bacterium]|nr:hypothetical protein [Anaerolineae bacterium]